MDSSPTSRTPGGSVSVICTTCTSLSYANGGLLSAITDLNLGLHAAVKNKQTVSKKQIRFIFEP